MRCCVPLCVNYSYSNKYREPAKQLRFYSVPTVIRNRCDVVRQRSEKRRAAWLAKIQKEGLPDAAIKKLAVCSDHFISGAPSAPHSEEDADWVPSVKLSIIDENAELDPPACPDCEAEEVTSPVQHHETSNFVRPAQSDSASGLPLNLSLVARPQDAPAEKIYPERDEYEALKAELKEYKLKYEQQCVRTRKCRDGMTELEVDKLELQENLKSAEETITKMKQEAERLAEIQRDYENLVKIRKSEVRQIEELALHADALTFRSLEAFQTNDSRLKFYTGLPDYATFKWLLDLLLEEGFPEAKVQKKNRNLLLPWQSLLMTLMRLRLAFLVQDLAFRFGVGATLVSKSFDLWLDALYHILCPLALDWPGHQTGRNTAEKTYHILKKPGLRTKGENNEAQMGKIVSVCCALTSLSSNITSRHHLDLLTSSDDDMS